MKVDINEVRAAIRERNRINSIPLELMELYDGEKKTKINPQLIEDWKFMGLNNIDFIKAYFIKDKAL